MSNHQHTLIIDGTSGISGDMTVAALLDLGASEEHLREQLATLPVDGFFDRCNARKQAWHRRLRF